MISANIVAISTERDNCPASHAVSAFVTYGAGLSRQKTPTDFRFGILVSNKTRALNMESSSTCNFTLVQHRGNWQGKSELRANMWMPYAGQMCETTVLMSGLGPLENIDSLHFTPS